MPVDTISSRRWPFEFANLIRRLRLESHSREAQTYILPLEGHHVGKDF